MIKILHRCACTHPPSLSPLSRLLPSTPHPNQTAHRPRQSNDAIIQINIPQSRTRDRQVAQIGDKLDIGCRPFPVLILQSSPRIFTYTLLEGSPHLCNFLLSAIPSPSFRSMPCSLCCKCHSVYSPAIVLNNRPVNHARYASRCNLFALAVGLIPAASSYPRTKG